MLGVSNGSHLREKAQILTMTNMNLHYLGIVRAFALAVLYAWNVLALLP